MVALPLQSHLCHMKARARPQIGHRELRRGRASLPNHAYHVISSTIDREPRFRHFEPACAASRCFTRASLLGDARVLAWVLMPDHVHWLLQLGRNVSLQDAVHRLKAASSRASNLASGRSGALWTRGYYERALRADDDVAGVARYIVANPLRAGLVKSVREYPFWDAVWLDQHDAVLL